MAYDFFPKSVAEIEKELKRYPENYLSEVVRLFSFLQKESPTPINIDKTKMINVNVSRQIKSKYDIGKISRGASLRHLRLRFGNGSSGGRGVNNKGASFEGDFLKDLVDWWAGNEDNISEKTLSAIQDLDQTYNLSKSSKFDVIAEGRANTKRPLVFSDNGITLLNPKGGGYDVGKSVSDITLNTSFETIFLSLKTGSTVTFFNVGLRTILTPNEIKAGKITDTNGKKLLALFGLDQTLFCDIFNGKAAGSVDANSKAKTADIEKLLRSGIGYGYHIIHDFPKYILSKKMSKSAMEKAADIGPITVYYGGLTGDGRRIDIKFDSPTYSFKLNIRDTQGNDGYPTRLMCDFTYR
jgi:hypothetical protein